MEHYAVADGLAPIAASTPWSPAPRGEQLGLLAAWGGGAADEVCGGAGAGSGIILIKLIIFFESFSLAAENVSRSFSHS